MQNIDPCLWFDNQAEEAAKFYVATFSAPPGAAKGESKVLNVARYSKEGAMASGQPEGSAMTVSFMLNGQEFLALNGGPVFKFTEAVSFIVSCENQNEVDHYWDKLSTGGGAPGQCGWLKDKFGLSWQIVPTALGRLMSGDPKKAANVMGALLKMTKLDIKKLQEAHDE